MHPVLLDAHHTLDGASGALCRGFRFGPRIDNSEAQRLALELRPILHVEPNAADGGGTGCHRDFEQLTDAVDGIDANFDGVTRHIPT